MCVSYVSSRLLCILVRKVNIDGRNHRRKTASNSRRTIASIKAGELMKDSNSETGVKSIERPFFVGRAHRIGIASLYHIRV